MAAIKKEDLRIIFMGTPEFAVHSLRILVENDYNIVGVITAPDRPAGRGRKLQESDVKKYALEQNLNILQPEKLKNPEFISELKLLNANLQIVVAFRMLPEIVWNMPEYGTFNLHASLLPQYRGAAPINWVVINGEKETGITTFFLQHEIDTGSIILQDKVEILDTDNAGSLHDKLMLKGSQLVLTTVEKIIGGNISTIDQKDFISDDIVLKEAPKIFKDDCRINWNSDTNRINNHIRGLSPYPAAWTVLTDKDGSEVNVKIFDVSFKEFANDSLSGSIETDNKTYIKVATKNGEISINSIQIAGKKRMNVDDLLRGFTIADNSTFI